MGPPKEPCSRASSIWERVEAGSDECLKDLGSRGLNVVYSTVSGGPWGRQIPGIDYSGWVRLKNLARARLRGVGGSGGWK